MDREQREQHAKDILDNPLFREAFEEVKNQIVSEWVHSELNDIDKRESLHLSIKLLDRLYAHVESVLETGQMDRMIKNHPFI